MKKESVLHCAYNMANLMSMHNAKPEPFTDAGASTAVKFSERSGVVLLTLLSLKIHPLELISIISTPCSSNNAIFSCFLTPKKTILVAIGITLRKANDKNDNNGR